MFSFDFQFGSSLLIVVAEALPLFSLFVSLASIVVGGLPVKFEAEKGAAGDPLAAEAEPIMVEWGKGREDKEEVIYVQLQTGGLIENWVVANGELISWNLLIGNRRWIFSSVSVSKAQKDRNGCVSLFDNGKKEREEEQVRERERVGWTVVWLTCLCLFFIHHRTIQ